jgi:glycosyltransferase involved in cell wall biosynthesis
MKILMIAPEPFFEPRGTPLSEYFRIKALGELGHAVDLVTYPIGEDRVLPGLKIYRCRRVPFIRSVRTGPSFAKLLLDASLLIRALGRLRRRRYDLIHTHEEASLMGVICSRLAGTPHLYDMHSSLVQQMDNFQFTRLSPVLWFFKRMERISLRQASSVIVICRSLYEYAAGITSEPKLTTIENFLDDVPEKLEDEKLERIRSEIRLPDRITVLYAGTLEAYQGIPLLLESMSLLDERFRLVIVGGKQHQVERLAGRLAEMHLSGKVRLLGQRNVEDIPYYLRCADVLVSPRTRGTNIPLKIYSYLRSGVPVVATDLYTHTQSISSDIAILAAPEPEPFAAAICRAAGSEGKAVAGNAREYASRNFTRKKYMDLVEMAIVKAVPG